jgi:hypothetical protein
MNLRIDSCDACGHLSEGLYPISPHGETIWVCERCKIELEREKVQ